MEQPVVTYTITVNGKSVAVGGSVTVSFMSPYNKVDVNVKPVGTSLSYFEARATKYEDDYDIGVGKLLCYQSSISSAGVSAYFDVNSTNFEYGNIDYRIGLYSKDAQTGVWDITYVFFTLDSQEFDTSSGTTFEVLTDREIP